MPADPWQAFLGTVPAAPAKPKREDPWASFLGAPQPDPPPAASDSEWEARGIVEVNRKTGETRPLRQLAGALPGVGPVEDPYAGRSIPSIEAAQVLERTANATLGLGDLYTQAEDAARRGLRVLGKKILDPGATTAQASQAAGPTLLKPPPDLLVQQMEAPREKLGQHLAAQGWTPGMIATADTGLEAAALAAQVAADPQNLVSRVPAALETAGQRTLRKALGEGEIDALRASQRATEATAMRDQALRTADEATAALEARATQPAAAPVEAMPHAGSDVSPEAINRVARGDRYVRVTPGGEVVPIVNDVGAVDVRVNPGEVKAVVAPDGRLTVEKGRPNAAQARALSALREEPPVAAPAAEAPVPDTFEIDAPEMDAEMRRLLGLEEENAPASPGGDRGPLAAGDPPRPPGGEPLRPLPADGGAPAPPELRTTGIKNAVVAEERAARGLSEVEVDLQRRGFAKASATAQEQLARDPEAGRFLAEEVAAKPRPLSAEESALLVHERMRTQNLYHSTLDEVEAAMNEGDELAAEAGRARLATIEERMNLNDEAARKTRYEQGLGLAAGRLMLKEDYSIARLVQRARVAGRGEVPEEVRGRLVALSRDLDAATSRIGEMEERIAQMAAEREVKNIRRQVGHEIRRTRRAATRQALDEEFTALSREFGSKAQTPRAGIDPDLAVLIGKMAKNRVHAGIVGLEELVDHIYVAVAPHVEGLTRRDVRDAISGYGKTSEPSKDEAAKLLAELKAQARLVSALEDAQAGEAPLRSGFQRGKPSDRVRDLQRQVRDAMRASGIDRQASQGDQVRTALDAVKARLQNQIRDLEKQIAAGQRNPPRGKIAYDAEASGLKAERDRLAATLDSIDPRKKPEMSDEQRLRMAEASVERSIADLEARIAAGGAPGKKPARALWSPKIAALKKQQQALREQLKTLRDAAKPARDPEAARLKAFKTRLDKRIAELEGQIASGALPAKRSPRPLALDPQAMALRSRVEELKLKADQEVRKLELAQRSRPRKMMDFLVKWRRAVLLSGTSTLFKLSAAAATRTFLVTPVEELIGAGISKALPGIAAKAPIEGGGSASAIAKSFSRAMTKAVFEDSWKVLKEGKSSLDLLYGKKGVEPGSWLDFFGHLHGAMKNVPKQAAFAYAVEKQSQAALRAGLDLSEPALQATIAARAYEYGSRAILMNDNTAVNCYRLAVGYLRNKERYGAAAALEFLFPIVKVPSNYVSEAGSYAAGSLRAAQLILKRGVQGLSPEEADTVLRNLKKQTVGGALLLTGYAAASEIGGYYQKGEERPTEDVAPGDVRLFGATIPHLLLHTPAFEMLQVGASLRRVHDRQGSTWKGLLLSTKGLGEQVPFVEESIRGGRALESTSGATSYLGDLLRGSTIPPDVQRAARVQDQYEEPESGELLLQYLGLGHVHATKRYPRNLYQAWEMGVPGLRKEVPAIPP